MKELSIKEKAERYDELLKKLRKAKVDNDVCDERYCCVIDDIVPELKESEDERIMQRIIHALHGDVLEMSEIKEAIAWLEKQGEQKPAWSEEEQQNIDSIIAALTYCNENGVSDCFVDPDVLIVWLKSLRPQKQWKPSEDQIMALRWVLNHIPYDSHKEEISGLLEQLKKLREE